MSIAAKLSSKIRNDRRRKAVLSLEEVESRLLMTNGFVGGYVTMGAGVPDANASVQLSGGGLTTPLTVQTNSDGYYHFDNVVPGTYTLSESHSGYIPTSATAKTTINSATPIGTSIQVKVVDPSTQNLALSRTTDPYIAASTQFSLVGGVFNGITSRLIGDTTHQYGLHLDGNQGNTKDFLGLCTDLNHGSGPGPYAVSPSLTPLDPAVTDNIGRIGYLYNHFGQTSQGPTNGAALQLAIWELLYDKSPDLYSGNFTLGASNDPTIVAAANSFLTQSAGKSEDAYFLNVKTDKGDYNGQSMICTDECDFDNTENNPLARGETATIGFWHNKNGQALINSLNGGQSDTQLGNWLATNFPNLYGSSAGDNNLAGKTNSGVASYFLTLFSQTGQKTGAQILATALAVYSTNTTLAGGGMAAGYGFIVSSTGTGAATYNVGTSLVPYGGPSGQVSIFNLLKFVNATSSNGVIGGANSALPNIFNTIFDGINQGGDIV